MSNIIQKIIVCLTGGDGPTDVAKRSSMSRSTVYRFRDKQKTLGTMADLQQSFNVHQEAC